MISPDRSSSGLFSPCPGRTLLTYPSDLLALASHLNISKFHLLGTNGGCPYLLACLKEIPRDKLISAQIVSGVWPTKLGMEGMRFVQEAVLWLSYYSPSTTGALMDYSFGSSARSPDPTKLTQLLASHAKTMPARDQEASSNPDFMNKIELACREAFRQKGEAAASEFGLWARDWGFELWEIVARGVTVRHGGRDGNAGVGQVELAVGMFGGCRGRFLEGAGHYVCAFYGEEILRGFLD